MLLLALACAPSSPAEEGPLEFPDPTPTAWFVDADGDGWGAGDPVLAVDAPEGHVASAGDCDDADAAVHPDVESDACDGVDADCDGAVDEDGVVALFVDADGDGWGGSSLGAACPAAGTATRGGDCDDADGTAHPDGVEVCGGGDEDCDGRVDADAVDASAFYPDQDGDGFGQSGAPESFCFTPAWWAAVDGDCDDGDGAVYPGAPEACGEDRDCDGVYDEAGATDCEAWYEDLDGDGWGSAVSACLCVVTGAFTAAEATDCDDTEASETPWGACGWVGEASLSDAGLRVAGATAGDRLGYWNPASAGDLDGDGSAEVVVTGLLADGGRGGAYVFGGTASGDLDTTDAAYTLAGAPGDRVGFDHDVGDLDGDGDDDLIVTATGADGDAAGAGLVYLVRDPAGTPDLADADARLLGEWALPESLPVAYAGDTEGDGVARVLIGATTSHYGTGAWAYLVAGDATGDVSLAAEPIRLYADLEGTSTGHDVDAGDLDGDGLADIVIGSAAGDAYVLLGPVAGRGFADADTVLDGGASRRLDVGGDTDGDGLPDLVMVGGNTDAWLLSWPGTGTVDVTASAARIDATAQFVAIPGDVDGDGFADVLVGDWGHGDAGSAWLLYGPVAPGSDVEIDGAAFAGDASGDGAGSVSGVGDLDGDGRVEFAVGAYGAGGEAGSVSIFAGLAR